MINLLYLLCLRAGRETRRRGTSASQDLGAWRARRERSFRAVALGESGHRIRFAQTGSSTS
eukprot:6763614-Alexandrium_andersonii.AAC.1